MLLGLSPKVGALIAAIPQGVLGGVTTVLYGLIAVLGARIWIESRIDFRDPVNLVTAAIAVIIGAADYQFTVGDLEFGGISIGSVVAVVTYRVMRAAAAAAGRRAVGLVPERPAVGVPGPLTRLAPCPALVSPAATGPRSCPVGVRLRVGLPRADLAASGAPGCLPAAPSAARATRAKARRARSRRTSGRCTASSQVQRNDLVTRVAQPVLAELLREQVRGVGVLEPPVGLADRAELLPVEVDPPDGSCALPSTTCSLGAAARAEPSAGATPTRARSRPAGRRHRSRARHARPPGLRLEPRCSSARARPHPSVEHRGQRQAVRARSTAVRAGPVTGRRDLDALAAGRSRRGAQRRAPAAPPAAAADAGRPS